MTYLQSLISKANDKLPKEKKSTPWTFVSHGVGILEHEDELNCYLVAYGIMHEEKMHTALSAITNIEEIVKNKYQIIDWGCGQGLATLCFFDFIKNIEIKNKPISITLIEPSNLAITKAKNYIDFNIQDLKIDLIKKKLDDIVLSDVKITEPITIHFFSNILDIETINLKNLATLIKSNLKGEHYFICVGPMNKTSTRIDIFAKFLNFTEEQLIRQENGSLRTTRGTIKLLVFKIKGTEIKIIKSIYYPPMPKNNNIMHILERKLNAINSNNLNYVDRIIEYYKLIVELEQLKEPAIDNYYYYIYEKNQNNDFIIDLETKPEFLDIFNNNREMGNRFPKDLIISIRIEIENTQYTILSYTYLFDAIKNIKTANEKIRLNLSSFELNYDTLVSKFEINELEIDELEKFIKEQNKLDKILNVFRERLKGNIIFNNQLSLALSSKNPTLSRIYSELRRINRNNVNEDNLLYDFLFNKQIDNNLHNFTEDDLIQITNLDVSQKKALLTAFNNKISVITGPPGSGKTQVISNILANAVMQNKKVLVASKNNQAVDNVKSRFEREEKLGFFLRFGNGEILRNTTLPAINRISALKQNLSNNNIQLQECQDKLNQEIITKNTNKQILEQRDKYQLQLPELRINVEEIQNTLLNLIQVNPIFENIRLNHNIQFVENYLSSVREKRNYFELKYAGLNILWINWFTKKKYAFELIHFINNSPIDFRKIFSQVPNQISVFKNGTKILESYNEVINKIELITGYYYNYNNLQRELEVKNRELNQATNYIRNVNEQEQNILNEIAKCEIEFIKQSKVILNVKIENKLFNASQYLINNYTDYLPDNIPWRNEEITAFENATNNFLKIFNIISVTSLSAKASLPLCNELFDMVVIDEASQCDIASAIPLILRAKQLVVIGDPLQLKHITSLNNFEEERIKEHLHLSGSVYLQYKDKSLWDYSKTFLTNATNNNLLINIDRHYRCHPDIIGYSNNVFYIPRLGVNLQICTKRNDFAIQPNGIRWVDIAGVQRGNNININEAEITEVIRILNDLVRKNPNISIGVVTPFRDQANEIIKRLPINIRPLIIVGTVHEFQGDEKDVMIYSLVVTKNSPIRKIYWIDNIVPYSVNVAVTRARNTLYVVGNKEFIRLNSINGPLGHLLNYIENLQH